MNILFMRTFEEGEGDLTDHKSKSILDKVNPITSLERKLNLLSAQYKKKLISINILDTGGNYH